MPRDFISVDADFTSLELGAPRERVFQPEGYVSRSARYSLATGKISSISLEKETEIYGIHVIGVVIFNPNGTMEQFEVADGKQAIGGIAVDKSIDYYGEARMWPTGKIQTVATRLVQENRNQLPHDLLNLLASYPNAELDRIRFFMNPNGEIRALEVEFWDASIGFGFEMYLVDSENGLPKFQRVTNDDATGRMISSSSRGYLEPKFVEYLQAH